MSPISEKWLLLIIKWSLQFATLIDNYRKANCMNSTRKALNDLLVAKDNLTTANTDL